MGDMEDEEAMLSSMDEDVDYPEREREREREAEQEEFLQIAPAALIIEPSKQ